MKHEYVQKKKATKRAVDMAMPMSHMETYVHNKLDKDGGKKAIYRMAQDVMKIADVKGVVVISWQHSLTRYKGTTT